MTGETPEYDSKLVQALAKEAMATGDAKRGSLIFRSATTGCTSCHTVNDKGGQVGPDLSAAGTTIPIERLIEEVLWPDRIIKEGFTLLRILTKDGDVIQGYPRKSRGDDLLLIDSGTKQMRRISKNQIDKSVEGGTAMPNGVTAGLTREELRDLIRYLSELGKQ